MNELVAPQNVSLEMKKLVGQSLSPWPLLFDNRFLEDTVYICVDYSEPLESINCKFKCTCKLKS